MFRTELTIAPAAGQLPRTARVLTMGSCFADSIGKRLEGHKVETRVNPFGTVFQPLALARLLRAAAGEDVDWQQHLVQARGRWQSYDLHGSIGAESPVELLQYIQEAVRQTGEFLQNADVLLLTLGTAWAYRLRETGELVSNCHKQSADLFVRELLTPDEIINALAETHAYLRRLNPELRFVLTVSPVRHLKDTLPLNAVSKSVLRVATHILSDLLPGVAYFPAFELLTDDLRDYRFYAADMLHPSEVAEDYIWDKFARTYFDAEFGRFRKEWAAVRQALGHRPLHEGAPEHRQFLENTRTQLEQLALRQVDVADELRTVHARIAALPLPYQPQPMAEPEDGEERIDIGDEAPAVVAKAIAPATRTNEAKEAAQDASAAAQPGGEGRPARLSPEEFRAQRAARPAWPERGRRDGRGKGQAAQPSEIEEFQAANFAQADEFAPAPLLTSNQNVELTPVASAPEATPGAETTPLETDGAEASYKKKRRSRGGAKRTARKNALREAVEMGLDEGQLAASITALEAAAATLTDGE
ncbi:MAG: GSCFA domain-containing protein, partial [Bacteroidota bacterium]|nr:GSCFA domain-containing protein [Bacteroidota bacterium]